jgi:transposase-like protein
MDKVMTLSSLEYYTDLLMKYIDKRIAEHNKVVIMRECPCCGAHDFKIGDSLYECAYCGSKFQYQTLYDKEEMKKIA